MIVAAVAASGSTALGSPAKLHGNNFFSNCRFSHAAHDDPIVHPGHAGASHAHTFFGNDSTNASSTVASLRRASTTCKPTSDTAAYWVPTLYQNGQEVRPSKAQLYYVLRGHDQMRPFPAGLRVVAGDAGATRPQSTRVTFWACGGHAARAVASSQVPERCGVVDVHGFGQLRGMKKPRAITWRAKTYLELHVDFPDCWDGVHLDSADHHSHMAYSREYVCPRSHPVKVPLIRMTIRYPIDRGAGVSLASGGIYSGHADFFNGWDQRALAKLVDDCFHDRPCNDPRRS